MSQKHISAKSSKHYIKKHSKGKWQRLCAVCAATLAMLLILWGITTIFFPDLLTSYSHNEPSANARDSTGNAAAPSAVLINIPDWIQVDLLTPNEYSRPQDPLEKVNAIVIHYVGNPGTTAIQNRNYFEGLGQTGETSASSHFVVGLDGEIIQCIPTNEIAYCSNWRNDDTIAIECCHPDADGKFTEETYDSLIRLVQWLCDTYELNTQTDVIRHYDVTGKICPKYYVDHEDAWAQFLRDLN